MSTRLLTLLLVALGLLLAYAVYPTPEAIVQPIAYNHNLHIEGEGLESPLTVPARQGAAAGAEA